MIRRKSQAALEFLMTYGWAILVVLVAVGALAYFGVLSPDKFLPAKCTLQSGIACLDHKATANTLTIVLQNSLGFDITLSDIEAGKCTKPGSQGTLANGAKTSPPIVLSCTGITPGTTKYNEEVNISYTVIDTGVAHKNRGQITTRIE
jgi:hypothetical protein